MIFNEKWMNWGQGWHFSWSQHLVSIMPWKEYQLYELTQCLMRLSCSEFRSRLIIVSESLESKGCVFCHTYSTCTILSIKEGCHILKLFENILGLVWNFQCTGEHSD